MKTKRFVRGGLAVLTLLAVTSGAAPAQEPEILRSRTLRAELETIRSAGRVGDRLPLHLFDDASYVAVAERVAQDPLHGFSWRGRLEGIPGSRATLVIHHRALAGTVSTPAALFQIRSVGGGLQVIREVRLRPGSGFEDDAVPAPEAFIARPASLPVRAGAGDSEVDILVLYTRRAKREVGKIKSLISLAIDETNQALAASKVQVKVRLVRAKVFAMRETTDMSDDLPALRASPKAASLRDKNGADFVILIVGKVDPDSCGRGYVLGPGASPFYERSGFAIVRRDCVSPHYSFEHELGHLMGLLHAREDYLDIPGYGAFKYSHGFKSRATCSRSIMAYSFSARPSASARVACTSSPGFGRRYLNYSNPRVRLNGGKIGSRKANAAKSVNKTRAVMSAYRGCKVDCGG